jgi:hypothetical protein
MLARDGYLLRDMGKIILSSDAVFLANSIQIRVIKNMRTALKVQPLNRYIDA